MKLEELLPQPRSNNATANPPVVIQIRELRRNRSLTQEELAEALGLSRQSINAMEAGRCLPSLPVALQIASFFSVPLHALFVSNEDRKEAFSQPIQKISVTSRKEEPMAQLVPWSPLREMREMLDEMMDETAAWSAPAAITAPAVNISQTTSDVLVEVRLPGYKKEDINLELGDGYLTISGEMKQEKEANEEKQYFRREFITQSFSRTVSLPSPVQEDAAEAEMKQGVLHIRMPKQIEEKPKTRRLQIKST